MSGATDLRAAPCLGPLWWRCLDWSTDHRTIPISGAALPGVTALARDLPAPLPPGADAAAALAALWSTTLAGGWASAGQAARARRQVAQALGRAAATGAPRGWSWPWELAAPLPPGAVRRTRAAAHPPPTAGAPRVVIAAGPGPAPPAGLLEATQRGIARRGGEVVLILNADLDAISEGIGAGAAWLILWGHGEPGRLALGPGGAPVAHDALAARLRGRLSMGVALSACYSSGADPAAPDAGPPLGLRLLEEGLPELIAWSGAPTVDAAARLLAALAPTWPQGRPRARARALAALRSSRRGRRTGAWDSALHATSVVGPPGA